MRTDQLIMESYTKVLDGLKRVDLENETHVVKAYQLGDSLIRIDIKEK